MRIKKKDNYQALLVEIYMNMAIMKNKMEALKILEIGLAQKPAIPVLAYIQRNKINM